MKDMAATPDTMHAGGTMPKLQQCSSLRSVSCHHTAMPGEPPLRIASLSSAARIAVRSLFCAGEAQLDPALKL